MITTQLRLPRSASGVASSTGLIFLAYYHSSALYAKSAESDKFIRTCTTRVDYAREVLFPSHPPPPRTPSADIHTPPSKNKETFEVVS